MKPWRYSAHALERMDEAEATYGEVEETLARPFAVRPGHSRRVNYYRSIDGFAIRVTLLPRIRLIITVYKEPLP
ncbi:MAG: DUF4258 domain-containing protein [Candidatus Eremiobacteraeota bacterium]|nr:DUF4258 domain-containing protein [Candidatus Eremiobacteraeota bacterium]